MNIKGKFLLLLILLIGLLFRVYGINFDETCCQHPDERAIVMFALPIGFPETIEQFLKPDSPANPHFFAYGNLPLYLLKSASLVVSNFAPELATYSRINLVGRNISVAADITTLILIFLLGRLLLNEQVGLAASFIYAVSVLPIQYSHFYTSDILLTMFVILTIYLTLKFYQNPNVKNAILLGISFGLSLATKISAIPLIIAIVSAIASEFIFIFIKTPHKPKVWLPHLPIFVRRIFKEGLIILFSTIITFIVVQPYALIDLGEFLKQNLIQSQMTHNAYIFPYTLQYVGKIPYIYELKNLFLWGLGPIIAIFSLFGLALVLLNLKKQQEKNTELFIVMIFFILYFAVVGKFAVGFMRYMLPIYPIFALLAGIFLVRIFELRKPMLNVVIILLIVIWPLSFISIYSKTNTRIEASRWIHENIPPGKTLAVEHWDDRLPMNDSSEYNFQELNLYDQPDDAAKWNLISKKIEQSNYIIVASNRLYIPIQKLGSCSKYKVCYPISSKYYQNLFLGHLGFKKIAEFSSYPKIPFLNITINDQAADESFTVYDHPKIMIFRRI